jgi:hypothetical protein
MSTMEKWKIYTVFEHPAALVEKKKYIYIAFNVTSQIIGIII